MAQPVTCILPDESATNFEHWQYQASQSLAKFRNAISTLAFSEDDNKGGLITNYLSWKELVHTCYFDVVAFRKIVALAISQAEGFMPTGAFLHDPAFARVGQWVADLGRRIETDPETGVAVVPEQLSPQRPVAFPA